MTDDQIQSTEAWAEYLLIRKAKQSKAPFTPGAKKRILTKLRMFAADGQDISEVLWTSVENGWTGVFEVKRKGWQPQQHSTASTVSTQAVERTQQYIAEHSCKKQDQSEDIRRRLSEARARIVDKS